MTQIKCRPPTVSYLASSVKPHCAQAWRGDQPSLSRASMKALFSSNIFAISTLPSILTCRDLCIKKQPNLELKITWKMSDCKCVLRRLGFDRIFGSVRFGSAIRLFSAGSVRFGFGSDYPNINRTSRARACLTKNLF